MKSVEPLSYAYLSSYVFFGETLTGIILSVSIYLLIDIWVVSTFLLLWILLGKHWYLFEFLLSIILGIYLEGELLGHMVIYV